MVQITVKTIPINKNFITLGKSNVTYQTNRGREFIKHFNYPNPKAIIYGATDGTNNVAYWIVFTKNCNNVEDGTQFIEINSITKINDTDFNVDLAENPSCIALIGKSDDSAITKKELNGENIVSINVLDNSRLTLGDISSQQSTPTPTPTPDIYADLCQSESSTLEDKINHLIENLVNLCNDKSFASLDSVKFSEYGCDLHKIEEEINKIFDDLNKFSDNIKKLKYLRSLLRTILKIRYEKMMKTNPCNINCK
jgi:hypothetical protein